MVILEQTETLLKLRSGRRSLWIFTGSWILGIPLFMMLVGAIHSWVFYIQVFPLFVFFIIISDLGLLIASARVFTCSFDLTKNRVILRQSNLFKTTIVEHSLPEILDIQVSSTGWNIEKYPNYEMFIILRNGSMLFLNLGLNSDYKKQQEIVKLIRSFIGLR